MWTTALLAELEAVGKAWEPQETLLVADAATGQTRGQGRAGVPQPRAADRPGPLQIRRRYARRRGAFLPAGDARCRSASSAPGRGSMRWNSFIPNGWWGGCSAWATSSGWSRRRRAEFDAASTEKMAREAGQEFVRPAGLPRPDQNGEEAGPAAKCAWHDSGNA